MDMDSLLNYLSDNIREAKADIKSLYSGFGINNKAIVNRLSNRLANMERYIKAVSADSGNSSKTDSAHPFFSMDAQRPTMNARTLTVEELTQYNGRNGKPAYVAINGIVYDVTGNAAWAAGTHFGLRAGNDLSIQFSSCHLQNDILLRLPVVGNLLKP